MIVRAILKNPDLADNFDFSNDFADTLKWLYHLPASHERSTATARLLTAGLNQDGAKYIVRPMTKQQQQIDQLRNVLTSIFEGNCEISIHSHALNDHLTVLQCDENGDTHELLINITYIENCDEAHT